MTHREVNIGWLHNAAEQIKSGKITMKEAAQNVLFDTVDGYKEKDSISTKQLHRYFAFYNMKVFEVGRKGFKKTIPDDLLKSVEKVEVSQLEITIK